MCQKPSFEFLAGSLINRIPDKNAIVTKTKGGSELGATEIKRRLLRLFQVETSIQTV